jgi:hypothetical protein
MHYRAFVYIVTAFGLAYCSEYLGNWGILVIVVPTAILFIYGLSHFEKLEKEDFNRFQKGEDHLRQAS